MKIHIIAVGSLPQGPELELVKRYQKRCTWSVTTTEILSPKVNLPQEAIKREEASIHRRLSPNSHVIVLDEQGISLDSVAFAKHLEKHSLTKEISICIGGSYGISPTLKKSADLLLSFGTMTWPHLLVRGMLMEQLYRAQQILSRHPYHKPNLFEKK